MTVDRLVALCAQKPQSDANPFGIAFTGIDFIQVVDPAVQDRLRVFFIVDPTTLNTPMVAAGSLPPLPPEPAIGQAAEPGISSAGLGVTIVSDETAQHVAIKQVVWLRIQGVAGPRVVLEVTVREPGDFSYHRLTIHDQRVDPFFNAIRFSFKQGCPSVFDCRETSAAAAADSLDYPVDYLARDFWSLRQALIDFASQRYPDWSEPLEADQAVMLMEIMAAIGDEFAYTQDRYAREAALPTATQRRSRSALTRLVDYLPDPGLAAETELAVWVADGGHHSEIGARAWAHLDGREPIIYAATAPLWHHHAWNEIQLHSPDSEMRCLPMGATQADLLTDAPTAAQLPAGQPLPAEVFWIGRRMILRSIPANAADPQRAHAVTVTAVEKFTDNFSPSPGTATPVTRLHWSEPLPWPLNINATTAHLNVVPVRAGAEVIEHFRIGPDQSLAARYPGMNANVLAKLVELPRAVERQGPQDLAQEGRGRLLRWGLRRSETEGLGWIHPPEAMGLSQARERVPLLSLREVKPNGLNKNSQLEFTSVAGAASWSFARDILTSDLDSSTYTLEEGLWRTVTSHSRPRQGPLAFDDYASDNGWTLRFGDGSFGRAPEDGTIFEVRYTTAPGTAANLSADSVVHLRPPAPDLIVNTTDSPADTTDSTAPTGPHDFASFATAITNPLAITSGTGEESATDVVISAPEAFRALPLRAVRPEDFADILGRLDWVQRANATIRWTGSWATYFVSADPLNGYVLSTREQRDLQAEIDCIRQVNRDARATTPDYVDIDLRIAICVHGDAYPGEVAERVTRALSPPGFFAPQLFSFGQPLRRSSLEAAIQAVPGVRGVEQILIRERNRRDWHLFTDAELGVEPAQIVRLQNDPQLPSRGSLVVTAHGGVS